MSHLIEHGRGRITVQIDGVTHTTLDLRRAYLKRRNALVVEQVQIWHVGEVNVRVSRLMWRRLHWALSQWRLTDVQAIPAQT